MIRVAVAWLACLWDFVVGAGVTPPGTEYRFDHVVSGDNRWRNDRCVDSMSKLHQHCRVFLCSVVACIYWADGWTSVGSSTRFRLCRPFCWQTWHDARG